MNCASVEFSQFQFNIYQIYFFFKKKKSSPCLVSVCLVGASVVSCPFRMISRTGGCLVDRLEDCTEKFFPDGFAKQKAVTSIPELFGRSMSKGAGFCCSTVSLGSRLFSIAALSPGEGGASLTSAMCRRIISSSLSY